MLAGGPGQSAVEAFGAMASSPIRERRDIVLLDQRGTAGSHALRCPETADDGDMQSYLEPLFRVDLFRSCLERLGREHDLTQYTSEIAADDLDELRAALGYEKIDLIGGSYGTRMALVMMRRHPDRVRAAVLDGVAPIAFTNPLFHASAAQCALDQASLSSALVRTSERPSPASPI